MRALIIAAAVLALTGCQRFKDSVASSFDGYVVICVEGTKYIKVDSDRAVALTQMLDFNGKPKACLPAKTKAEKQT